MRNWCRAVEGFVAAARLRSTQLGCLRPGSQAGTWLSGPRAQAARQVVRGIIHPIFPTFLRNCPRKTSLIMIPGGAILYTAVGELHNASCHRGGAVIQTGGGCVCRAERDPNPGLARGAEGERARHQGGASLKDIHRCETPLEWPTIMQVRLDAAFESINLSFGCTLPSNVEQSYANQERV